MLSAVPTRVRERRRIERRDRIKEAAWAVFRSKAWEEATTREIARRAGIAAGTLFLYARDKRELLLMLVNDELEGVTGATFADLDARGPFTEQVLSVFRARFSFWAGCGLPRSALAEAFLVTAPGNGVERQRFDLGRSALVARIAEIVAREQSAGRIKKAVAPAEAAAMFMTLYRGEVRNWLVVDRLDPEAGVARLRAFFRLLDIGLRS